MNFLYAKWILLSERYGTIPVYFNLNNVIFIDSKSYGEGFSSYLSQLDYALSIYCAVNGEHFPIQNVPFICFINIDNEGKADVFPYSPFQLKGSINTSSTSKGTMFLSNISKGIGSQVSTSLDINYLQYKYIKEQIEETLKIKFAVEYFLYLCREGKTSNNILLNASLVGENYYSVFEETNSVLQIVPSIAVSKFKFYNSYKSQKHKAIVVIPNIQKVGRYNSNFFSIIFQTNTNIYVPSTVQNPVYFSINKKFDLDFIFNYLIFNSLFSISSNSQLNVSFNINNSNYAGSINSIENLVFIDYNIIGESLVSNRQTIKPKINIEFDLKTSKLTLANLENMNGNSLSYYDSKTIQEVYYL